MALADGPALPTSAPVGVIDIGSNTTRLVVVQLTGNGHLETLADAKAPMRLVRDLATGTEFGDRTLARTLSVVRGFRALAEVCRADRVLAVATSAVREAANGEDLVRRVLETTGVQVDVIDGQREAYLAFMGAIHGLPVEHGLLVDQGGGSVQIAHFRERQLLHAWTLPLGALRLSDRYLESDPPTAAEVDRLRAHVLGQLKAAKVPKLGADEVLVGTGGTIRNIAKVDRRRTVYPIQRLHGYTVRRSHVRDVATLVRGKTQAARASVPGLNAERTDSIVGGVSAIHAVMEYLGASDLLVSGQGLREGLALEATLNRLPPAEMVRQASIDSVAARFSGWLPERAAWRAEVALKLLAILEPAAPEPQVEALRWAARVTDVGRAVNFYNRFEHAATAVLAADLGGFSHRTVARISAVLRFAGDGGTSLKAFAPLLDAGDERPLARAGVLLWLADEMLGRIQTPADLGAWRDGSTLTLSAAGLDQWTLGPVTQRVRRAWGVDVRVEAP